MSDALHSAIRIQSDTVCAIIAPAVLAVYDHILTLSQEIDHIWRRKFTTATVIFVVTRYLTLGKVFLLFRTTWSNNVAACTVGTRWFNTFDCIITFVNAVFNALRIWAIWDRKWFPSLLVLMLSMATPANNMYRASQVSVLSQISPYPLPLGGCLIDIGTSASLWENRTVAITVDAIIILMTWIKTYGSYKSAQQTSVRPPVTTSLLRDGTLYFGTLFVANILMLGLNEYLAQFTALSSLSAKSVQLTILPYIWPTILNSMLISRFLLNLRGACYAETGEDDASVFFGPFKVSTTRIIGDLGEDLEHTYDIHQLDPSPSRSQQLGNLSIGPDDNPAKAMEGEIIRMEGGHSGVVQQDCS